MIHQIFYMLAPIIISDIINISCNIPITVENFKFYIVYWMNVFFIYFFQTQFLRTAGG